MRYENPFYMAEDAGSADLISGGRLQLGHQPRLAGAGHRRLAPLRLRAAEGETDADMGRRHTEMFLELLEGEGFAQPNPRPMFPNPPGLLRLEPHSAGLRDRIWWGSASDATALWAAQMGMNLQSSTLKADETRRAVPRAAGKQIDAFREAWAEAGHAHDRASRSAAPSSRSRMTSTAPTSATQATARPDRPDRRYCARSSAVRMRPSLTADRAVRRDEAIAEADTLLLTVPNQLGVDYNAHLIESMLTDVAPGLGWR